MLRRASRFALVPWMFVLAAQAAPELRVPREELDDEPAALPLPAEDPGARSPGLQLIEGSYVSVQVNVNALGQNIVGDAANEPSIAVNPNNEDNMVIGWRQFDTIASNFRQAGWAFTLNGGTSWTFPGKLTPGTFRSDPVLDSDSNGIFYYQSLQSDFTMQVFRSTNGGVTWGAPIASFGGDKNWMAVDKSGSLGDGHVYGVWREAFGCCGPNVFTRSINGGSTYQSPVPVARSPGLGTMAVGPDGEVYVTGIDELGGGAASYVVVRSLDARNPSDPSPSFVDANVSMLGSLIFGGPPNPGGLIGQANVAVDHSFGPTRGNVYLLSTVDPLPPAAQPAVVHISRSENGGVSWSEPVRVNDDPNSNNAWHWFGAHSVAPDGRIDVVWNDTRDSGSNQLSRLYYSYSYDGGENWAPNVAVSPQFNSTLGWPNQNKIGDYYTLVSDLYGAHVAYSATFNGEQDVYYVYVFPDCNSNGVPDGVDSPDCNGNDVPDECEQTPSCGPAGTVPDGHVADQFPLMLGKTAGAAVVLSWGASCKSTDSDYGIYEGPIGSGFNDHAPAMCSTGGSTTQQIVPDAGSRYFLIVPRNADREGSYGRNSAGQQRPVGLTQCAPRQIAICPVGG